MRSEYFDPLTYTSSLKPNQNYNYGIQHVSNDNGELINGFNAREYPAKFTLSNVNKHNQRGNYLSYPSTTSDKYMNTFVLARLFMLNIKGLDRQKLIVEKLGFTETGKILNEDKLFIYNYSTENAHLEIYINDRGEITELNRFHQDKFYELKLPINVFGIQYIISQIFYDICKLNLSNISFSEDEMATVQKLLNLKLRFKDADTLKYDDIPPINDFNTAELLKVNESHIKKSWLSKIFGD